MTKERSWRKDAMGSWQFHWGVTSRREIVRSFFNWRPTHFNLGCTFSVSPSGFNLELAFWFNWSFCILFFVPSQKRGYDDEDDEF